MQFSNSWDLFSAQLVSAARLCYQQ